MGRATPRAFEIMGIKVMRVERLEEATTQESIDKWMGGEIKRYGGRRIEVDDAE